ncbi:hypothetical protein [Leptothoe spongobia]|uniref:Uncharacterized protein n=1 Tax=Leptothoe spongobia TAU-MAC 1115 TaxID=1967444 RepID=A0A947DGZ2_9CYAN|nr:hypothetical protein [Leptothoe spongobia]MBT9316413.1 hypothetical protein [Leptothoe spongobia TAU-MAC 1115]
MGLPVVLDIALGLMFVYMALGLIASEAQEIVSTMLQWRAEHLKYSIEQLLAGGQSADRRAARRLADQIYNSPMVRDLNYEAQGVIARSARQIIHVVGRIYRLLSRTRNVFGDQTSGPSYIPSEAFATTLLESLQLEGLQKSVVEVRLKRLLQERIMLPLGDTLHTLRAAIGDGALLDVELRNLEASLEKIFLDYRTGRTGLAQIADRVLAELDHFADQGAQILPESYGATQAFIRRLGYLRSQLAGGMDMSEGLVRQLQPTLKELLALINSSDRNERSGELASVRQSLEGKLPLRLKESLSLIAERVTRRTGRADDQLKVFQQELEQWYDRGMDRAGGVYRRNSKIVGILIGIAIAAIVNADTFYMANRLTVNQAVRTSVIQTIDQVPLETMLSQSDDANSNNTGLSALSDDLQDLGNAVQTTLSDYSLPIGRSPKLLATQAVLEADWALPIPRRWFGWGLTGIAVSMGSSFWFDALRRVMSVRTSGSKPTRTSATANDESSVTR